MGGQCGPLPPSLTSARDILIGYVGLSLLGSFGGGQLRWEGLVPVAGVAATLLFLMVVDHDSAGAKFRAKVNTALYGKRRGRVRRSFVHRLRLRRSA
jgi:hypothetical protein